MKKNLEATIRELQEYKRMRDELDATIESLTDEIKAEMGDQEVLLAGPFKVLWKTVIQNRLDSAALKKELPDVVARYTKPVTTRPFKVA